MIGETELKEKERRETAQGCVLVAVLSIAVISVAIAVGMFFGAQWGAAVIAAFAVFAFARMKHIIKRERKKERGGNEA